MPWKQYLPNAETLVLLIGILKQDVRNIHPVSWTGQLLSAAAGAFMVAAFTWLTGFTSVPSDIAAIKKTLSALEVKVDDNANKAAKAVTDITADINVRTLNRVTEDGKLDKRLSVIEQRMEQTTDQHKTILDQHRLLFDQNRQIINSRGRP